MTALDLLKVCRRKVKLSYFTARQEALLLLAYVKACPIDLGESADDLKIKRNVAARAVETLVDEHGFLKSATNKDDARKVFISITAKGCKFVESLEAAP